MPLFIANSSSALDAGDSPLASDQRGVVRPQGASDDIGAFELGIIIYDCGVQPWLVGDEVDLNSAIDCYNSELIANSYTISITQNIGLTASSKIIDNPIVGMELQLEGGGFTIDGQGISGIRPFTIAIDNTVTMQNITITGGNADGLDGGGIANSGTLTVSNSILSSNAANNGGGIFNDGTLTVSNSTLSSNSANLYSGGIYNNGTLTISNSTLSGNSSNVIGGGVYNNVGGTALIVNSTLNDNSTGVAGGGIHNNDTFTVMNSTFSSNSAGSGGGAIYNNGTFNITNSTLTGNTAVNDGGGIFNNGGSSKTLSIDNTVVANSSSGGDCFNNGGTINDNGYNIVEDNSCGFVGGSDPLLGPLQDNGGDTFTHALLDGSPAIDAGDSALTSDQRGITRPQGAFDDIGSFEQLFTYDIFLPIISNSD